jgi:membrane-associated protease RseP (regulator of RpoE activity)
MSESVQTIPPFVERSVPFIRRHAARPTVREWTRHAALFLLTAITTTIAGIMMYDPPDIFGAPPVPSHWVGYITWIPEYYLRTAGSLIYVGATQPSLLAKGATFAGCLLAILTAHEFGHYIACRRYGVDATLPFFIPAPPLFLAGTFGAFIRIKSPIPSRKALFDIGVAGPLAGFAVLAPIAVVGLLILQPAPPITGEGMIFNDPLLFRLVARALGVKLSDTAPNPFYMAAWIGLLVTSLNLIPVSQLDGGHAAYALFGPRIHRWLGFAAFAAVAVLAVLGVRWHGSPTGILFAVLLAVMLRVRHPQPQQTEPLGAGRQLIAVVTLIVFALSFWPFPITIT